MTEAISLPHYEAKNFMSLYALLSPEYIVFK